MTDPYTWRVKASKRTDSPAKDLILVGWSISGEARAGWSWRFPAKANAGSRKAPQIVASEIPYALGRAAKLDRLKSFPLNNTQITQDAVIKEIF